MARKTIKTIPQGRTPMPVQTPTARMTNFDEVAIGYSQENPDANINLIIVLDAGWSHAQTNPRVSTLAYDGQSGAVLDYDIEVNNQYYTLNEVDLHNILARDLGMALGFDKNSGDPDSIMQVSSSGQKQVLSAGDTQALCQLFPGC